MSLSGLYRRLRRVPEEKPIDTLMDIHIRNLQKNVEEQVEFQNALDRFCGSVVVDRVTPRDEFAMAALKAMGQPKGSQSVEDVARWAYQMADAMMQERAR